jgi:hypothetical protein
MDDPRPPANPHDTSARRDEPVACPHCGEPTMPNRLADESYVCSCPVQRALPLDASGRPAWMPPPVDDRSFVAEGPTEHPMPPAPEGALPSTPPEEERVRPPLPEDRGQFGRDIATEGYKPLATPPARREG